MNSDKTKQKFCLVRVHLTTVHQAIWNKHTLYGANWNKDKRRKKHEHCDRYIVFKQIYDQNSTFHDFDKTCQGRAKWGSTTALHTSPAGPRGEVWKISSQAHRSLTSSSSAAVAWPRPAGPHSSLQRVSHSRQVQYLPNTHDKTQQRRKGDKFVEKFLSFIQSRRDEKQ